MSDAIAAYDPSVDAPAHHHPVYDYDSGPPVERAKFAIWLFLATEVMFFTGLIGTYVVIRMGTAEWPEPGNRLAVFLTSINTFILITSSYFMVKALHAGNRGDQQGILRWLGATIIGGAVFVGVQCYEYYHQWNAVAAGIHFKQPSYDLFWSCFYAMTGFHGLHVSVGVLWLIYAWFAAKRGKYTSRDNLGLELAGLYWHFVDLVWVVLFTIVYLF